MSKLRLDAQGHPIIDSLDDVDVYLKPRNEAARKEKLYDMKGSVLTVDHLETAQVLCEFISAIPDKLLDRTMKKIMIMRIGRPAMNGRMMTHLAIALELAMPEHQVRELEKIGKNICTAYLKEVTLIEPGKNTKNSLMLDTLNQVNAL